MGFENDCMFESVEDVKATFLQLLRCAGKVVKNRARRIEVSSKNRKIERRSGVVLTVKRYFGMINFLQELYLCSPCFGYPNNTPKETHFLVLLPLNAQKCPTRDTSHGPGNPFPRNPTRCPYHGKKVKLRILLSR